MEREGVVFESEPPDGRFVTSEGTIHARLENIDQKLAFPPEMSRDEFEDWQDSVRAKLRELLRIPEKADRGEKEPRMLWSQPRDGYELQEVALDGHPLERSDTDGYMISRNPGCVVHVSIPPGKVNDMHIATCIYDGRAARKSGFTSDHWAMP